MKYLITKTDISINGKIHSEGSVIDSTNFSKEDLESISNLLVPLDKSTTSVTLDTKSNETPITTNTDSLVTKRNRKPKTTN